MDRTRPTIGAATLAKWPELVAVRDLGVLGGPTDRPAGYVPQLPYHLHLPPGPAEPPAAIPQPSGWPF